MELREDAGWSRGELASKVGTDASQISRCENGRITPPLDVPMRTAEVLNVSLDYVGLEGGACPPLDVADHGLGEGPGWPSASSATRTAPRRSTSSTS